MKVIKILIRELSTLPKLLHIVAFGERLCQDIKNLNKPLKHRSHKQQTTYLLCTPHLPEQILTKYKGINTNVSLPLPSLSISETNLLRHWNSPVLTPERQMIRRLFLVACE